MFRISTCFTFLLLLPAMGFGQPADPPKWDFAVTAGLLEGQPGVDDPAY